MTYIRQTGGPTCALISALNALIFYGRGVKNGGEGESKFKKLAQKYHCLKGPCLGLPQLYDELGLDWSTVLNPPEKWVRKMLKQGVCVQLSITTPDANLHAVLLVGAKGKLFEVVNSQIYGPHTIELLTWKELGAEPGRGCRKLWSDTCVVFHAS